jgi:predicted Zn-dependent peptidase
MTRDQAHQLIADLLNEWFPDVVYSPEKVAEELDAIAEDDAQVWDPSFHYAHFAMTVLKRGNIIEPASGAT